MARPFVLNLLPKHVTAACVVYGSQFRGFFSVNMRNRVVGEMVYQENEIKVA